MNRTFLVASALGVSLLLALPVRADLFDDFEGAAGPLDSQWDVTIDAAPAGSVTVGQSGSGWAAFSFTGSASVTSQGKAWTDTAWNILDSGSLTWAIDFRVTDGTASTIVVPFAFDTDPDDNPNGGSVNYKDADVSVTVQYETGWAYLNLFNVAWATFKDAGDNWFEPDMSNSYTQTLTMTLTDTKAIGVLTGTDDFGDQREYTAWVNHGLDPAVPGYFGMHVFNSNAVGMNPKTIEFDNVLLTPEPVSLALAMQGLLALGGLEFLRRRRRRRAGGIVE